MAEAVQMKEMCLYYNNHLTNMSLIQDSNHSLTLHANDPSIYNLSGTNLSYSNLSTICNNSATSSAYDAFFARPMELSTLIIVIIYGLISAIGLLGNSLVIFVITRYTKLKTVTNMYIVNLSVADGLFLLGLPMVMSTAIMRQWVFGFAMCKVYYILTCINMFTGAFTLTVMSGDRFLAACYPITSIQYRTPKYAMIAIMLIWFISFIVMMPVILYAENDANPYVEGIYTCTIKWPAAQAETGQKIFLTYTLLLGFVVPVLLITILYSLLIISLAASNRKSQIRSAQRRRSHRKVTKLVTLITAVYIICWLPYWAFQIDLIVSAADQILPWKFNLFKLFTLLSYANSMVNPLLYAFTNHTFKEAFIGAFRCTSDHMIGGGRRGSDFPSTTANNNIKRIPSERDALKTPPCAFLDANDCEVTMLTATVSGHSLNVSTQTKTGKVHNGEESDDV